MAILIFLGVLFVLVLVHELGHFLVAKRAGMRVDEFGIGFPPKLLGIKRGETEYTLNLLPIGGFVRIFGEDATDASGSPDRSRSFVGKSRWAQAAVLIAGVAMNALFAWLVFSVALMLGTQTAVSEANASDDALLVITDVLDESPAARAGLAVGDVVRTASIDGTTVDSLTPTSFSSFIAAKSDEEIMLRIERDGDTRELTLVPEPGVIKDEPATPAVGVALSLLERVSVPVHTAIYEGFILTVTGLKEITVGISMLLFDAFRLDADLSQVAGPVGIVGLVGEASAFGITTLLMFTGFISLNLAVINLLPFPALDGGRLLFVGIEAIKGSPIRPNWVHALNMLGFVLLILLMLAVTFNDIVRII